MSIMSPQENRNVYMSRIITEEIDMMIIQRWIDEELEKGNKFLSQYGLSVVFNPKYNFESNDYYRRCVAIYQNGSVKRMGRIRIGINFQLIKKLAIEENYEKEVRISIWHEIGHGIIEYLKGLRRKDTQCGTMIFKRQMLKDFREIIGDEEYNVEEFGHFMVKDALYTYSALDEFLNDYQDEILRLKNQEGGSKWMNQFIEQ